MDQLPEHMRAAVHNGLGLFLTERLLLFGDEDDVRTTGSGKIRSPNTPVILALIQFTLDFNPDFNIEIGQTIVDMLIENNYFLTDWECMTDLLLEEPGEREVALTLEQELALVELMDCCLEKAATWEAPVQSKPTQGSLDYAELKNQEDKRRVTEHFLGVLPALLDKYETDFGFISNLLHIPQYYDLGVCARPEQEGNFDLLLGKICNTLSKVSDRQALDIAGRSLQYMCTLGSDVFEKCDAARCNVTKGIVNKYKEDIAKYKGAIDRNEQPNEDQLQAVVESLKKVACLLCFKHIKSFEIWDSLFEHIQDTRYTLPEEGRKYCIDACRSILLIQNRTLIESVLPEDRYDEELRKLKDQLGEFIGCMSYFIDSYGAEIPTSLVEEAVMATCEVLNAFQNPRQLVFEAGQTMLAGLHRFVEEQVFLEIMLQNFEEDFEVSTRRDVLSAYCELVSYNRIPVYYSAHIFKNLIRHANDYGDIINSTIERNWNNSRIKCALSMELSLNIYYSEIIARDGLNDEFLVIRDLARRFVQFFGHNDHVKNGEAVVSLHKNGICHATSFQNGADPTGLPINFGYLSILMEFSQQLVDEDKKVVLDFLESRIKAGFVLSSGQNLQPLLFYRSSLL